MEVAADDEPSGSCTPSLPGETHDALNCSHVFQYRTTDFVYDLKTAPFDATAEKSSPDFLNVLRDHWKAAESSAATNYALNCMYKLLPGDYGFSMQLNVERGEKRRKPVPFQHIREPFSDRRWNFLRLAQREVMTELRCVDSTRSQHTLLVINAAPIESCHSLLLPEPRKRLPQILTRDAIRVGVDVQLLSRDATWHVLYNSLLGFASVNHLHLHVMPWPYESDLCYRRWSRLDGVGTMARNVQAAVIRPPLWPVHVFGFQLSSSLHYESFVESIHRVTDHLCKHDIAHNLFMTRAPSFRFDGPDRKESPNPSQLVTCWIFPRKSILGSKPADGFNPAALELSGLLTAYNENFFLTATEQSVLRVLEEHAALSQHVFEAVHTAVVAALSDQSDPGALHVPLPRNQVSYATLRELTNNEEEEMGDSFFTFEATRGAPKFS